jgi:hypothetical protein
MENRRRARELETVEQRAQDAALQAYLEQMGRLLLEMGLRHESVEPSDEQPTLARAYTLTTLEQVGSTHKRTIVRFLFEAGLISASGEGSGLVDLFEANLSRAYLSGMRLAGIRLGGPT